MNAGRSVILIAEDEAPVRKLLHISLIKDDIDVRLACDGQQAVEVFRRLREEIDLVLMDVQMPGLDGPSALKEMQEINPDVLCCFTTGVNNSMEEDYLLQRGAVFILHKPFKMTEVLQVVRHILFNHAWFIDKRTTCSVPT